jgi:hypothetical protein
MVAKEVFVNFYNFNPISLFGTTCSNPCKKVLELKSRKVIVKVRYPIL